MEDLLAKLRLNESRTSPSKTVETVASKSQEDTKLDKLVADLQEQNLALKRQGRELKGDLREKKPKSSDNSSSSYTMVSNSGSEQPSRYDIAEMMRVKQELHAAKSVISRQEQELAETRTLKHTMDQAMGPPEIDYGQHEITEQTIGHLQSAFNASARPFTSKSAGWRGQDDARSDCDFSAVGVNSRAWNQVAGNMHGLSNLNPMLGNQRGQQLQSAYPQVALDMDSMAAQRSLSGSSASMGYDPRFVKDLAVYGGNPVGRRNAQFRNNSMLSDLSIGSLGNSGMSPPVSPFGLDEQYLLAQRSMGLQPSPVTPGFPATQLPAQNWSLGVSNLLSSFPPLLTDRSHRSLVTRPTSPLLSP